MLDVVGQVSILTVMTDNVTIETVNRNTHIVYVNGSPEYVLSDALNLDAAMDAAQQYIGEPFDYGTWGRADDSEDLMDLDVVMRGRNFMAVRVES